jgi:soluble lytic murein transglycosylase-like protein
LITAAAQTGFLPDSPIPQAQAKFLNHPQPIFMDRQQTKLLDQQKLDFALLEVAQTQEKLLDRQQAKRLDQQKLETALLKAEEWGKNLPAPQMVAVGKKVISSEKTIDYVDESDNEKPEIHWYIHYFSNLYGVDPLLVQAVIRVESRFDPYALSKSGAMGLMQINQVTAKHLGLENPFDIGENIEGGTRYLQMLLKRYYWDIHRALAAYNAGPATVERFGGIPPYPETRRYIWKVIDEYRKLKLVAAAFGGKRAYQANRPATRLKIRTLEAKNDRSSFPGQGKSGETTLQASNTTPGTHDYQLN